MQQENRNYGRDQNIFNQPGTVIVNPHAERLRDPVQRKLLEVVRGEVSDRLAQSLHRVVGASLINLTKESQPGQVRSPWQMELWQEQQPPQRLPPETTIAQVFDQAEVERKLLILGEPGSGKTTTMLELARELVPRAEAAVDQPIPVLLNLSSWKPPQDGKQDPFLPWLLAELKAKYGIRQDLSKTWLATSQLLPLLDGLDEVAPQHQEACATAINQWLTVDVEQRPMGLVVCCRIKEYEEVVRKRLYLEGAIALLPLTDDQIEIYLTQFGLEQVWHSAQTSETLQELLSNPLFLSIFGFVASQKRFDVVEWRRRTTEVTQREYLLDQYWDAAMMRELVSTQEREKGIQSKTYRKKAAPKQKALRRALVFAAQAMERESLTELLIERIQPHWLPTAEQQWRYRLTFGLIVWLFLALIAWLILGLLYELFLELILGSFFGLIGGLISLFFTRQGTINPVEAIQIPSWGKMQKIALQELQQPISYGVTLGLAAGLISGLIVSPIVGPIIGLITGLSIGPFYGFIYGLIIGVIYFGFSTLKCDLEIRIHPNQGIKISGKNMLIVFSLLVVLAIPFKWLLEILLAGIIQPELSSRLVASFLFCYIYFCPLEGGGQAFIQHVALRLIMLWYSYVPFRYDRLLNYATERLLLQRIGGRYCFMHKLLQEHFAAMDLDN